MRRRLACLLVLAAAAAAACAPTAARADGDAASDVLVYQDVFPSYVPPDRPIERALERVVKQARNAGFPMKVALIGQPSDLGAYSADFGLPNQYATLLSRELPTNPHGRLRGAQHILVVMPAGFGGSALGPDVDRALKPITIDASSGTNGLAVAAIGAVARVATVNGHRVAVPPEASLRPTAKPKAARRSSSPLLYLAPVLLLFAGVLVARLRARRRTA